MAPLTCPTWCTNPICHQGHMRDAAFGRASVALYQLGDKPAEVQVWDQSEMPYRFVSLDPADALTLARALSALAPEDVIRFAHALAEGAKVLADQDGEVPR